MKLIAITQEGLPEVSISSLPKEATDAGQAYISLYRAVGYQPPWIGYLVLMDGICVGSCGFKAPPKDTRVEIAYFTFPDHEGKGIGTQMASALVKIAADAAPQVIVAAQTLPKEGPSTSILKKLGFKNAGTIRHPEDGPVWEWQLAR